MSRKANIPYSYREFRVAKPDAGNYPAGVEDFGISLGIAVSGKKVTLTLSGGYHQKGATYSGSYGGTWSRTAVLGGLFGPKYSSSSTSSSMDYHGENVRHGSSEKRVSAKKGADTFKAALHELGDKIYGPFYSGHKDVLHSKLLSIGIDIPIPEGADFTPGAARAHKIER